LLRRTRQRVEVEWVGVGVARRRLGRRAAATAAAAAAVQHVEEHVVQDRPLPPVELHAHAPGELLAADLVG
jgi:hypothetical protein